jgi:hypothetical protein
MTFEPQSTRLKLFSSVVDAGKGPTGDRISPCFRRTFVWIVDY